ncbi:MAG: aa3-type cytochrome c oxidase subunit IV [Alphaproteobacteria bacterium]
MAEHGDLMHGHDLKPHVETWNGFLKLMYYAAGGVVLLLVFMALVLL